jgi:hypothetical protein
MNRPIVRIVATDGKAYLVCPAGVSTVPAQGTPATPSHGTQPSNERATTGEAGVTPLSSVSPTLYGPPTTSKMTGAGGPFSDWDCKIAKALARGDFQAVDELKQARADINIKLLQTLEPVWVPTESQLAIGMMMRVAAVEGVCTLHTQAMQSEVRL